MKLRVVIADDELQARKRLARLVEELADAEIAAVCDSAEAVLAALPAARPDVLLLDISMPGLGGLALGRRLAAAAPHAAPAVIFVTAHATHALDAFELGAVDYVVKPVTGARLAQALSRVRRPPPRDEPDPRIPLPTRAGVELVDPDAIVYAAFDGALVTIVGVAGTWITTSSLKELEAILPQKLVRADRRHLLNLDHVTRLVPEADGGYLAITTTDARVPLSRQAARALRRRLGL